MKNVLFVVDERAMGGVSVILENILTYVMTGYDVDLLVLSDKGTRLVNLPSNIHNIETSKFFEVIGINIKVALKSKNLSVILKKVFLVFLLSTGLIKSKIKSERKKILKKHYDVEIAFKDGFCSLFTGFGDSDKKIVWVHTDYNIKDFSGKYKKLMMKSVELMDNVVILEESLKSGFVNKYGNDEKVVVVNNYINIDNIIEKANAEEVNLSDKKLNMISIIRYDDQKRPERLAEVFNMLKQDNKLNDCHLTIIGDGPLFNDVKNLIDNYELNDYITIAGRIENPFPYLKKADLFVLPSVHEAYPTVVIEALTLDVPVLSTELTAIRNMMKKTEGLVVDNSVEGLYQGLTLLIDNPNVIENYKEEARKYDYRINNERIKNEVLGLIFK